MEPRFVAPDSYENYQAFIFDCDGTLADTMPAHHEAWKRALAEGGGDFDFTWEIFVSRAGMSMEATIEELGAQFDVPFDVDFVARRQRQIYDELSQSVGPIVEVLSFARRVAQQFPVAVASGSSRPSVERTLNRIGAENLFPVIVTPEDVTQGKPHPDMFLLAAEKLGVAPSCCLVIEDGELGFEAARRAQMNYLVVACPNPTLHGSGGARLQEDARKVSDPEPPR